MSLRGQHSSLPASPARDTSLAASTRRYFPRLHRFSPHEITTDDGARRVRAYRRASQPFRERAPIIAPSHTTIPYALDDADFHMAHRACCVAHGPMRARARVRRAICMSPTEFRDAGRDTKLLRADVRRPPRLVLKESKCSDADYLVFSTAPRELRAPLV